MTNLAQEFCSKFTQFFRDSANDSELIILSTAKWGLVGNHGIGHRRCDIGHTHRRHDVHRRCDLSVASLGLRLGSHIAVSACNPKCMLRFWPPGDPLQATDTHDLNCCWVSAGYCWYELPALLSSDQASKLAYAPSSIYIAQQFLYSSYVQCIAFCLPYRTSLPVLD